MQFSSFQGLESYFKLQVWNEITQAIIFKFPTHGNCLEGQNLTWVSKYWKLKIYITWIQQENLSFQPVYMYWKLNFPIKCSCTNHFGEGEGNGGVRLLVLKLLSHSEGLRLRPGTVSVRWVHVRSYVSSGPPRLIVFASPRPLWCRPIVRGCSSAQETIEKRKADRAKKQRRTRPGLSP